MMAGQPLTMFSVDTHIGKLCAIVPDFPREALLRLRLDDPVWERPSVYQHWFHVTNMSQARVRVRDRIKFWCAA